MLGAPVVNPRDTGQLFLLTSYHNRNEVTLFCLPPSSLRPEGSEGRAGPLGPGRVPGRSWGASECRPGAGWGHMGAGLQAGGLPVSGRSPLPPRPGTQKGFLRLSGALRGPCSRRAQPAAERTA